MLGLPKREYLRVDEVAEFFSVTERAIRLWIDHGHLDAVKVVGGVRIKRESILCLPIPIKVEERQAIIETENSIIRVEVDEAPLKLKRKSKNLNI